MHVVITGASGLLGTALAKALRARSTPVTGVTRDPGRRSSDGVRWVSWDALPDAVGSAAAVVHLAGAGVVDRRWTAARKRELHRSRIGTAERVVEAIKQAGEKPSVLISASASGYYGSRGAEELGESAAPGDDFLARLCMDWEAAASGSGVRTVILRLGLTLSAEGGALKRLLLPFRLGLGGPVGWGGHYVPWIHVDDTVGAILHAMSSTAAEGPLNLAAPVAVTNRELSKALGRVLHRPALLPLPPALLQRLMGERASLLTTSQRMLPQRLQELGYDFAYPELEPALRDLVG